MTEHQHAASIFRTFNPGEIVFRDGEPSYNIYFVESGQLQVFTDNNGQRVVLGEVNPGEFVGELGVLQESNRNASVVALRETRVQELNKWAFVELLSKDAEKSIAFLRLLSCRTQHIATLSKEIAEQIAGHKAMFSTNPVRSFLSLTDRSFKYLKSQIYRRENLEYNRSLPELLPNGIHKIKKNRVLFCEGQTSHYACRVIRGKFRGIKSLHNSYEDIGYILPGEFIGEIGLLEDTPRNLTVVAVEESEIEAFDEESFLNMVKADPEKCMQLIHTLSRRSIELNTHLKSISAKYASALNPTMLEQAKLFVQNIGDVSFSTSRMLEKDIYKLQRALQLEASAVQHMFETYYRYAAGKASKEEMENANAEFRNFLKTLGLGAMIVIPGSFITIPLVIRVAKTLRIDILPKSRIDSD